MSTRLRNRSAIAAIAGLLGIGTYFGCTNFNQKQSAESVSAQTVVQERARSADSFMDSIGVAVHLRYLDTSYGRYTDVVEPRLRELGIRHIRDGGNNQEMFNRLNRLALFGIKSTLVMDLRDKIDPQNVTSIVKKVLPSVVAIEGPNEWDVNNVPFNGKTYPQNVREYHTGIFNAMKRDPVTRNIPVLGPSIAIPENGVQVGSLESSMDFGNMHSYAGGNPPGQDLDTRWIPLTQRITGSRPIIVTETGYHNAVNDSQASQRGVSEAVSAKYIPRTYLDYFRRGIRRTFTYELMDERAIDSQENRFGLVRFDGSRKPAFDALRNMISILKDKGSGQLGTLSFSLSGDTQDVQRVLLQKVNRDYFLVLWLGVRSTDAPVTRRVTLNLATPISRAATYLPNRSTAAVTTTNSPQSLTLDVPDAPLIVQLTPR